MNNQNLLKRLIIALFLMTAYVQGTQAQVGVGTSTPDSSAVLDVSSTTKGVLFPRMTTAQRLALSATAPDGLMVYDTERGSLFLFRTESASWSELGRTFSTRSNTGGGFEYQTFGSAAFVSNLMLRKAGGSSLAPTAVALNDRIGYYSFAGADGTFDANNNPNFIDGFRLESRVDGPVTTGSVPVRLQFDFMAQSSTTRTTAMTMKSAGNIGMGTITPAASAKLEISSTTQGFLPPRMTSSQMGMIPAAAEGLVVYCTNCSPKGLRVYNGTAWEDMNGNVPAPATFSFTGNFYHTPNFFQGRLMNQENILFIEVNVTTAGQINISSNTVNGYSFSGTPVVADTGIQYLSVLALGTLTTYSASGNNFTITGIGTSTQTQAVTISHTQSGSSFTTYSNGGTLNENFSSNTNCSLKPISASHNSTTCNGSVTIGSNTYPIVLINGQCWFQTNLKEAPTAPCASAINTGCNVWLNTAIGAVGAWGYYNTTTTNGTAGWATTEPAAGEGILYQAIAALNNETYEGAKGVCPIGWHIPTDCEWMYLEHGQGMSIALQTTNNTWRSTTGEGNKLRGAGTGWTNTSGFTALLGGSRGTTNGVFQVRGTAANYFTSTSNSTVNPSVNRTFESGQAGVRRASSGYQGVGFVRCLKN